MASVREVTGYLEHLPAILREDPALVGIVRAFEALLAGSPWSLPGATPIEAALNSVHRHFQPLSGSDAGEDDRAPEAFLPWLAGWVGVSLRDDWGSDTRRRFLADAIPLYRLRGTRNGLSALLELFLGDSATFALHEFEGPRHFFQVDVHTSTRDPHRLARIDRCVRAIIDGDKPAHTVYGLRILFPTMHLVDDPQADGEGIYVDENTSLAQGTYQP